MPNLSVQYDDSRLQQRTARTGGRLRSSSELFHVIANRLRNDTMLNFRTGGRWPQRWLRSGRVKRSGGQTLVQTANLRNSISLRFTSRSATVGTPVKYGRIHQFGGTIPPRTVRPKNKKALRFFGPGGQPVFAKSARIPATRIPARPFLPATRDGRLRPETVRFISAQTQRYLES